MQRLRRDRCGLATVTLVVVTLVAACTSAPEERATADPPATSTSPAAPTQASSSSPATPSEPEAGPFELVEPRVSLRPPSGGSFGVRGLYPFSPSSCVRPDRPTLDGRYPGALTIRAVDDGTLTVSVTLRFRQYLEGIAEVPPTWPTAALEAQVIAARSYVLSRTGWTGEQGADLDTPICATSDCQVYGGIPQPKPPGLRRWYAAVQSTRGQVLLDGDRPADTLYFSTSNGRTYGNDQVFGSSPLSYLRPVTERDDGASPLSHWRVELPFDDLATVLRGAGSWPGGAPITSANVDGSVVRLAGGGESRSFAASDLRDIVNTWGPCLLPGRYPSGGLPTTIPSGWFGVSSEPARPGRGRPRMGTRRRHGPVGRVRQGEAWVVHIQDPGLLLRRPHAAALPRTGHDAGRGRDRTAFDDHRSFEVRRLDRWANPGPWEASDRRRR